MRKFLVFLPLSRHPLEAAVLDFVRKCVKVSNWIMKNESAAVDLVCIQYKIKADR